LHLITLILYEEKKAQRSETSEEFKFTEKDAERMILIVLLCVITSWFIGAQDGTDSSIYQLLKVLIGHPNITHDGQKQLLTWVIEVRDSRGAVCVHDLSLCAEI
jgi:hypothetical protein